ncbi:Subtilisin-like serine proteases [Nocardioides sp. J9]|uniref:S8 family serine peptidase n=1 Tax=Nocardioides sp. J9 TaxID=935844 RepID=UPI00119F81D3|nr:S8 family serine peptidase [Nocardioides sp. J9]TWG98379.1 Subtilisin-like serine proteases [Nocardioides sp. J9]
MHRYPDHLTHPSGVELTPKPDRVLLAPRTGPAVAGFAAAAAAQADVLATLGLVAEGPATDDGPLAAADVQPDAKQPVNEGPDFVFARTPDGSEVDGDAIARAEAEGTVGWAAPVYTADFGAGEEELAPAADAVVLLHADVADPEDLARVVALGLERDEVRSALLGDHDYFTVADPAATPAYDLADRITEALGRDVEVRLEWVPMRVPVAHVPNDPMYADQWNLRQIGAAGPGTTGWDLTMGSASVVVAILDEGVELGHPDLAGAFVHNGINLGTMSGTGAPTGDHGTPCAGIVAARTGNGTGVAGLAGRCRILPIAFSRWTDTEVAAGIRYARMQGAHVISMSFGWNAWDRAVIDPAIQEAFNAGLVMCVATHNHNTANGITYPATNPLVIAVGASDQADNRKSPSSPDGEGWGSNYGPQISVVAPGVRIPSTDRLGANGYTANDYTPRFNGTSAATPHVAALAALIRSRNSSLNNVGVRRIIEQTAAKVGTVPYANVAGHPNGTWNEQMGYGRIDVLAALQRATPVKRWHFEDDLVKHLRDNIVFEKRFKEIREIDIYKLAGREVDDLIDLEDLINPVRDRLEGLKGLEGLDEVVKRLERIEKRVGSLGSPFLGTEDRPDVSTPVVEAAVNGDGPS